MLAALLLAALQAPTFVDLDDAHGRWLRCVIPEAGRLAAQSQDDEQIILAAYRACEREEGAVRTVLAGLHPDATPADITDIVDQFKRRSSPLVQAAIASARPH